ncbi:MAG: LysE family translocator [Gammaproteobacteria bacterium]|nr:LysE family translocator [Gammaproteobacteria bacterium]
MLGIHDYWLFVATGILLNLTPGQDTFFILSRSIAQGTRMGIASALGISAGSLLHTTMAAVGLSAILATSAYAFMVVKLVGAAYLVFLGVRMLMTPAVAENLASNTRANSSLVAFRDGALTNILNPKVALFFLALMPQFIDPASDTKVLAFIALGLTFIATGTIWCLVLAISAGNARDLFVRRPKMLSVVSRVAGGLFVMLGLRLAISRQ